MCYKTCGALLLCGILLDKSGTSPSEVLLQSLNMLSTTAAAAASLLCVL
jgi:hypothetical protein